MKDEVRSRRPQALLSAWGVTYIHRKHPFMIGWWSAAFPGFGHFMLNQYLRGTLLTLTEVFINTLARINETLLYSFSGRPELAKQTLEVRWAIGYMLIYMFAIWDSTIASRSMNKLYALSQLENSRLTAFMIRPMEVQFLDKRNPFKAAAASLIFPGMGQMYNHRVGLAFYAMFWWWIYISFSRAHVGLQQLLLGNLEQSRAALHGHWLLFMPSVTGGAAYHAFVTTIEHNRLFRVEQRQYLAERYGSSDICIMQK